MTLPFQDARTLADSARALALEAGQALSIAVVDYGGFVVLVERMGGARPMTPSIALSKAYSAAHRDLRRQPGRGPEDLRGRAAGGRLRPRFPRVGGREAAALSAPDGKGRHRIGRAQRCLPGGRPPVPPDVRFADSAGN